MNIIEILNVSKLQKKKKIRSLGDNPNLKYGLHIIYTYTIDIFRVPADTLFSQIPRYIS